MNVDYLLDNSKPFDQNKVQILDKVMAAMHSGDGQQVTIYILKLTSFF